ncbi:hypothetical protein NL676_024330 [Syzygium grande]|nr:hypothetical protein NL676_024330 [Syzygium grande]
MTGSGVYQWLVPNRSKTPKAKSVARKGLVPAINHNINYPRKKSRTNIHRRINIGCLLPRPPVGKQRRKRDGRSRKEMFGFLVPLVTLDFGYHSSTRLHPLFAFVSADQHPSENQVRLSPSLTSRREGETWLFDAFRDSRFGHHPSTRRPVSTSFDVACDLGYRDISPERERFFPWRRKSLNGSSSLVPLALSLFAFSAFWFL